MSARFEWAHATDGPNLVDPHELAELDEEGNPGRDWGLAFSTGSDGCMIHGSLGELRDVAARIVALTEHAERER